MKKRTLATALLLMALFAAVLLSSCSSSDPWASAKYTEPTTLGTGSSSVSVLVSVDEHSVLFTVMTDKETLGEAILDSGLAEGDMGPYGLYIKTVNGILADYDVNGAYWGIYVNGEASMVGADGITLADGELYELRYMK